MTHELEHNEDDGEDTSAAVKTEDQPAVDELAERLRDVDAAMELLQAGKLDAAERAIEELEARTGRSAD